MSLHAPSLFGMQRSAIKDPGMGSLNANTRVLIGKDTVWQSRLDLEPTYLAPTSHAPAGQAARTAAAPSGTPAANQLNVAGSTQLRRRLKKSELRAHCAVNQKTLALDGRGYDTTPVTASLEVGTPCNKPNWLQYRLGLLQVTAPDYSVPGVAASGASEPLRTAVYAQGAVAVTGDRTLWQAPRSRRARPTTPATAATATAATASLSISPHNPLLRTLKNLLHRPKASHDEDAQQRGHTSSGPTASRAAPARSGPGPGSGPSGASISLPRAETVLEAMIDATHSASRLQEDVVGVTTWVREGGLVKGKPGSRRVSSPRGTPWSTFTHPPHAKVSAAAGLASFCQLLSLSHPLTPPSRPASGAPAGGASAASAAAGADRFARLSEVGSVAGKLVAQTRVSPFASGAVSLQVGHFQKWALDFTQLTARLDTGFRGGGGASAAASDSRLYPEMLCRCHPTLCKRRAIPGDPAHPPSRWSQIQHVLQRVHLASVDACLAASGGH
ncbi:MAG: hypothetical protein WDW38_006977 [Sanguina aurantia]